MHVRSPFVADGQPTKAIEPGERPLDHPAMAPQPLARVDAAAGNSWADAALATGSAAPDEVIPFVRRQLGRTLAWTSPSPPQGWDGVQRDAEHERVMHIGAREGYGAGDASSLDHNMALRARFGQIAAICWIRPGRCTLCAPLLAATRARARAARDQSILSASASRWSSSRGAVPDGGAPRLRLVASRAAVASRSSRCPALFSPVPAAAVPSRCHF